jgi:hypothetical protein
MISKFIFKPIDIPSYIHIRQKKLYELPIPNAIF